MFVNELLYLKKLDDKNGLKMNVKLYMTDTFIYNYFKQVGIYNNIILDKKQESIGKFELEATKVCVF